ncbi:MAG: fatty acid desaturase [Sulfitobacter sp.]|nr:fatty acid desaturase [Sulfitobacter sp.]
MTHIEFIAGLDPARRTALMARSNRKGLAHLAGHLGGLLLMGGYIALQGPFWGLVLLPYGITLVFLFTLSHECTHATPFATPWLNRVVGHAIALPLLLPFTWFRYFHLAHHRWTNDPERDPELRDGGRPETWRAYLIYLSGWRYWVGNARLIWAQALGHVSAPYLPTGKHSAMRREARLLLLLYAVILLSLTISPFALWLWIVPALLGQPFLRLYLLAEHGHCPPVADMFENSRTTFTNRIIRALAWNMPYHAEHHAMPMVPFHALPILHDEAAAALRSTSEGYARFSADYARGLSR